MRRAFPEATVTGYEQLVGSMTNDQGDRHVLATAVHAGAEVIVTSNVEDFPKDSLAPCDIEVQTPDQFLEYLYDLFPDQMVDALIQLNAGRQRPPETLHKTLDRLAKSASAFTAMISLHGQIQVLLKREEEQVSSSGHRGSPGES